jgi:methyl-accepting chemotaxis protein
MTTGSENNGASRLDRIERIVESNARAIEANSNTIAENDARTAERFAQVAELVGANTNSITLLRDTVAAATATAEQANQTANNTVLSLVDGFDQLMGRIDTQGTQFLEIVGQVRDLQIQNNRILNRLEGLESQGGQG